MTQAHDTDLAEIIERNGDFAKIRARGAVYTCMQTLGKWEAVRTESVRFAIGSRTAARSLIGLAKKLGDG
jgi:hypothetical protein